MRFLWTSDTRRMEVVDASPAGRQDMGPKTDRSVTRREFLAALAVGPAVLALMAAGGMTRLFGWRSQPDLGLETGAGGSKLPPGAVVLTEEELTGPHNLAG